MPNPNYCWDSGVFIALLTGESARTAEEIAGMREVVDLVDRGGAIISTSAMAQPEVLSNRANPDTREKFEALFKRQNFQVIPANSAIFTLATEIREEATREGRSIRTPDAIFIATAVAYRLDALHTFDEKLLAVSGRSCARGLLICKPRASQTVLGL